MNVNEEFRTNQLDEAHQDVLSVLDNLPTIELTKEEVNKVVEHIAGHKNKIYFDYIEDYIRNIRRNEAIRKIMQETLQKHINNKQKELDNNE